MMPSDLTLLLSRLRAVAPDVRLNNISPETREVWKGYKMILAQRKQPSVAQRYVQALFTGVYRS